MVQSKSNEKIIKFDEGAIQEIQRVCELKQNRKFDEDPKTPHHEQEEEGEQDKLQLHEEGTAEEIQKLKSQE